MLKFIGKRLLWMIPIAIGVSLIVFALISLVPGDPASTILGPSADQAQIDALNTKLGFYDPFWVRYFRYMGGVIRLDFGESYVTKIPVIQELKSKIVISVIVAFSSIAGSLLIGVPLGILSAVKQYSLLDVFPTSLAMVLAAAPSFWVGLMLILVFSLKLGWLPSFGVEKAGWFVLPMLTLTAVYGATMLRFTRSSMLETVRQDYIRTVRAKGAAERVVIWRHALKNALLPVITAAGNTFGALLGGAIVTETLFSLPGLGTFVVNGIKQRDIPVVMGGTITLSVLFSFVVLAVDLIYAFVDPRVKAKYTGRRS
ncbi:MAG: ABC transporter permease [Lachnospiraceae bacterium]|nr:ABC transporter permease [Lachnospiraceae bacterium]